MTTTRAPHISNIPESLRSQDRWVLWAYEERGGKSTKVPYSVAGSPASSTDPTTWAPFLTCLTTLTTDDQHYEGLGFMLGNGFTGIDLDHVLTSVGLHAEAERIVRALDSYTEVSPSGSGVKIIARGTLPPGWRKRNAPKFPVTIEMYDAARFFTITGNRLNIVSPFVKTRGAEIAALHARVASESGDTRNGHETIEPTPATLPDDEILQRCRSAANAAKFERLWAGDTSLHGDDDSSADAALCAMLAFWTQDEEQIERLFGRSKLADREKWQRRADYRERTVRYAITNLEEAYAGATVQTVSPTPNEGRRLTLIRLNEIPMKPVPWLWPGYIASGAPTLLVGDPDQGKSLVTCDLVARITTGRAWPDGIPGAGPRDVVILSAEDSPSYTIRPRLTAAGADGSRVHLLTSASPNDGLLSLKTDVAAVEAMLRTVADPALLFIDPMNAYLPGIDTFKDNDVRSALGALVAMAERRGIAVLAIIHLNKNSEQRAIQRILGSIAFAALARGAFAVVTDPDDANRRLFLPVKMNISRKPAGLAFTMDETRVQTPEGRSIETVRARWNAVPVKIGVDEVLRRMSSPRPSDEATSAIRAALAEGPVLAKDMDALCTRHDVSTRTTDRVKKKLGIESTQRGGAWYWTPPGWTKAQVDLWDTRRRVAEAQNVGGQGEAFWRPEPSPRG